MQFVFGAQLFVDDFQYCVVQSQLVTVEPELTHAEPFQYCPLVHELPFPDELMMHMDPFHEYPGPQEPDPL